MSENTQLQFIWNAICEKIKGSISIFSYNTNFELIKPIDIVNRCIVLKCPSDLAAQTIMNNHADILRKAVSSCGGGITGLMTPDPRTYFLYILNGGEVEDEGDASTTAQLNYAKLNAMVLA